MISQPSAGQPTEVLTASEADRRSRANIVSRMAQIEARIRRIHNEARCFGSEPWHAGAIRLLQTEYESLAEQSFILTDRLLVPELYPL